MDTKPLLFGLVGFFLGGLVVSVAASTLYADEPVKSDAVHTSASMDEMVADLREYKNDAFDRLFIDSMIEHHEGALDMARLAQTRAQHQEIRDLSNDIIRAQEREIQLMKSWRSQWGYSHQDGH